MRYSKFEMVMRPSRVYDSKYDYKVSDPDGVAEFAIKVLEADVFPEEHFYALSLSNDGSLVGINEVSKGTIGSSFANGREVFRAAILQNAAAIILLHNHPSGNIAPSDQDIEATKRLCEAGKLLDIRVLDHVIVGHGHSMSFKKEGVLSDVL